MVEQPVRGAQYIYRPTWGSDKLVRCEGLRGQSFVITLDVADGRRRDVPRSRLHHVE